MSKSNQKTKREADESYLAVAKQSGKTIEKRLVALEKMVAQIKFMGAAFAVLGMSCGGILWFGYDKLKEREVSLRTDYEALQGECNKARDSINAVKAENANLFSSALDKYDKMSESYLELRKNVTKANDEAALALATAGDLIQSVDQANAAAKKSEAAANDNARILGEAREQARQAEASCRVIQETQLALEEYLAAKLQNNDKRSATSFTVEISGTKNRCAFIPGESIPYSRKINGVSSVATIVVPDNSICIVRVSGTSCKIGIKKELQGRVIVENTGTSCDVTYF